MHWLILFPYYFFTALNLVALFVILSRLLRVKVSINSIVLLSVGTSAVGLLALFAIGVVTIDDLTGWRMLALGLLSFSLAGVDGILMKVLRSPLDEELHVEG